MKQHLSHMKDCANRMYVLVVTVFVAGMFLAGAAEAASGIFAGPVTFGCNVYKELTGTVAMVLVGITAALMAIMNLVGENRGIFSEIGKWAVWGSIIVTLGTVIALAIPAYRLPPECA